MAGGASTPIPDGRPLEDERFHKFCSTTVHHLNEPVRMIGIYVDMLEASAGSQLNGEALQSIKFLRLKTKRKNYQRCKKYFFHTSQLFIDHKNYLLFN